MLINSKNRLLQLPLPREDETLHSLVARIRSRNVYRSDLDACRHLLGQASNCRVDEYPVNVAQFCEETSYVYGTAKSVLDHFTLLPHFAWTGKLPWHSGVAKRSPLEARHGLGQLCFGAHLPWRACGACIEEEKKQFGDTYWHRSHQLPMSLICSKHKRPLMMVLRGFKGVKNRLLLPDDVYSDCTSFSANSDVLERWDCLAKIDMAILENSSRANFQKADAAAAFLYVLKEQSLLDKQGAVDKQALMDYLHSPLVDLKLPLTWLLQTELRGAHGTRTALASRIAPSSQYLTLLIYKLFGCWETFSDRCRWEEIMSNKGPEQEGAVTSMPSEAIVHRKSCINLLEQAPAMKRNEFSRAAPKSFRWLLIHDKRWLDEYLPAACVTTQLKLFP
ncbi:TniQ family protein [Duganella radicis]|nr:TniQ family protein [Duganella radicis]